MIFIEAPNKFIWFYSKFWVKQAIFDVLMYWFSAAQQTSSVKLPDFFPDILNRSEYSKGEWTKVKAENAFNPDHLWMEGKHESKS